LGSGYPKYRLHPSPSELADDRRSGGRAGAVGDEADGVFQETRLKNLPHALSLAVDITN